MNVPKVSGLVVEGAGSADRNRPPSSAELEAAAGLAEELRSELQALLLNRADFRRELREAVADGDRMLADFERL